MTRTIDNNPIGPAPIDVVHLIRLKYWDGAAEQEVRLTDAVSDLDIDINPTSTVETWTGSGVLFSISSVAESADLDEPGVDLVFDGVDQAIISVIMNNNFRGRQIEVWRVWLDPALGTQVATAKPIKLFDGFQNEQYSVSESFTFGPDAVQVATRAVGSVSRLNNRRNVLTNPISHNEMLDEASLVTGDTFFQNVSAIQGREIFWGRKGHQPPSGAEPWNGYIPFNPDLLGAP